MSGRTRSTNEGMIDLEVIIVREEALVEEIPGGLPLSVERDQTEERHQDEYLLAGMIVKYGISRLLLMASCVERTRGHSDNANRILEVSFQVHEEGR